MRKKKRNIRPYNFTAVDRLKPNSRAQTWLSIPIPTTIHIHRTLPAPCPRRPAARIRPRFPERFGCGSRPFFWEPQFPGKEGRMQSSSRAKITLVVPVYLFVWDSLEYGLQRTLQAHSDHPAPPVSALDFEVFRPRIEPICSEAARKRECEATTCHAVLTSSFVWNPIGSKFILDRVALSQTFEVVLHYGAGEPLNSRLLLPPTFARCRRRSRGAPGGKFWKTQSDPEWQMVAEWVRPSAPAPCVGSTVSNSKAMASLISRFQNHCAWPFFLKGRPGHASATAALAPTCDFIWPRFPQVPAVGPKNNPAIFP